MAEHPTYEQLSALCAQMAAALEVFKDHYPTGVNPRLDDAYRAGKSALTAYAASSPDPQYGKLPSESVIEQIIKQNVDELAAARAILNRARGES